MKTFLTILFFIITVDASSQDIAPIENGMEYKPSIVNPFMNELYEKNDFIVLFRTVFADRTESESPYFVLTGDKKQLNAYRYSTAEPSLVNLNLPISHLNLIWKTFQQNELFRIRDEKDIPNFCAKKYDIYGSYTYEFTILSKGFMKVLSYYNPEYYSEACFGISERLNIINSVAIIDRFTAGP